jgi:hypothetical protein
MPNKKIKVSEATVAKLRKGTMAGNLAKAKGASPEMREALTRFYGSSRVNAAIGKSGPGSIGKPKPLTPKPNDRENRKPPVVATGEGGGRKGSGVTLKPSGGPGAKSRMKPMTPPKGGPGAKPRQKPMTPPKGGPGARSRTKTYRMNPGG